MAAQSGVVDKRTARYLFVSILTLEILSHYFSVWNLIGLPPHSNTMTSREVDGSSVKGCGPKGLQDSLTFTFVDKPWKFCHYSFARAVMNQSLSYNKG